MLFFGNAAVLETSNAFKYAVVGGWPPSAGTFAQRMAFGVVAALSNESDVSPPGIPVLPFPVLLGFGARSDASLDRRLNTESTGSLVGVTCPVEELQAMKRG